MRDVTEPLQSLSPLRLAQEPRRHYLLEIRTSNLLKRLFVHFPLIKYCWLRICCVENVVRAPGRETSIPATWRALRIIQSQKL